MIRRKSIFVIAFVVGVLALSGGALWHAQTAPTPFDKRIWLEAERSKSSSEAPRLRMADGLIGSRVLLGKSQSELETMLGPPTATNKFREYGLVYWLGAERGLMSIDSEWLVVRFDKANKAFEASIISD
jgi:hypothetical protein